MVSGPFTTHIPTSTPTAVAAVPIRNIPTTAGPARSTARKSTPSSSQKMLSGARIEKMPS